MTDSKKGQIALVFLLLLATMLTIGLGVISRTVTEIKMAEQEKESVRAFSAAEAGIEKTLRDPETYLGSPVDIDIGDLTARVSVTASSEHIRKLAKNSNTKFILEGAGPGLTGVTIYWTDKDDEEENPSGLCDEGSTPASLEVAIYSKDAGGSYFTKRYAYNACENLSNGFSLAGNSSDADFLKEIDINIDSSTDKLMAIRALYNKTTIKVAKSSGSADLPAQEYQIVSRSVIEDGSAKAIEVSKTVPLLPEIFDYVLFSGGDLIK